MGGRGPGGGVHDKARALRAAYKGSAKFAAFFRPSKGVVKMTTVIPIDKYRNRKHYDQVMIDCLDAGWKNNLLTDVVVITSSPNGDIGIMGNDVDRPKAIEMIRFILEHSDQLNDIIV